MAYDEQLAERIRALIGRRDDVSEMEMFGGLAFLINRHMAVAASGRGGIMVRTEGERWAELIEAGEAEPMEMRGGPMRGWLRVGAERLGGEDELGRWVREGVAYAESLPPKRSR